MRWTWIGLHRAARTGSLIAVVAALALPACRSYQPQPLDETAAVREALRAPDLGGLQRQAQALAIDFSRPLTGDEVAVLAVLANPELRSLRAQRQVGEAQVFAAGLLPDPQLSLNLDRLMAPTGQGLANAYAIGLTFDLFAPLLTRQVELAGTRAAAEQVRLDIAWQELNTAAQAKLLALRLPLLRSLAQSTDKAARLATAQAQRLQRLSGGGDVGADEGATAAVAATRAEQESAAAAREAEQARLELNQLLGLAPDAALAIRDPAPLAPWQEPAPELLLAQARARRLDLQALAAGHRSQEAGLHRAVLGQYPRLSLSLNRARDTGRVHTFGPAIGLDLPLWNRNRGEIAVASATRDQLAAEYAARLQQTRADLAALIAALALDEPFRERSSARLPELDDVADRLAAAADRGDLSRAVADDARARAIGERVAWLTLQQSCTEQRLALQVAAGGPVVEAGAATPVAQP